MRHNPSSESVTSRRILQVASMWDLDCCLCRHAMAPLEDCITTRIGHHVVSVSCYMYQCQMSEPSSTAGNVLRLSPSLLQTTSGEAR